MKQKFLIAIAFFIIGACVGGITISAIDADKVKNNEQAIIDNARLCLIEFNKEYNKKYSNLGKLVLFENNEYAGAALSVMQLFTPKLIELNKSLKLDCTQYHNDSPTKIEHEDGTVNPIEGLPEKIRILK